jgi:uncharacterized protein YebE (UPF0316 family)
MNGVSSLLSTLSACIEQALPVGSWLPIPVAYYPIAIFLLRTTDITISTLRTFNVARGRRLPAWILGFLQALLFVTATSAVLTELGNILNLLAFAAGMATGNVIGMTIERLLSPGHSLIRMYSPGRGEALARELRQLGYGATLVSGKGLDGTVALIYCYVPRRQVPRIKKQIIIHDPDAYISVENVRQLRGGWGA